MTRTLLWVLAAGCGSGVSHDPTGGHAIAIPAGPFEMGCHRATDPDCNTDELPYHEVALAAFQIDETEVTEAGYAACVDAMACTVPAAGFDPLGHPMFPVTNVSWYQATSFCAWAQERLPTEAEWEKAARGTDVRIYPWGSEPPTCELANFDGCGDAIEPVGMHPTGASPYGVLDLAGNAAEWVADWYSDSYYAASPSSDPPGPDVGTGRVKRGGDFTRKAFDIRVGRRGFPPPGDAETELGFRCARSGS